MPICLLLQFLYSKIHTSVPEFSKTCFDFDNYINRMCNSFEMFDYLTVFERMFGTCAFVWALSYFCRIIHIHPIEWAKYSHICWAMYFDKYTKEFYDKGGWTELKRVANDFISTNQFLKLFQHEQFLKFKIVTDIYDNFKRISKPTHHETASISWVKFNIKRLRSNSTDTPLNPQNFPNFTVYDMEKVFQALKKFSNPLALKTSAFATDCIVKMKPLNDDDMAINYNKNSISSKTAIKETEMHLQPFKMDDASNSDNLSFSVSSKQDVLVGKTKMPLGLTGSVTINSENLPTAKINESDKKYRFKNLEPEEQIKSHNNHDIATNVSLDIDCHLRNEIYFTEEKLCQNGFLKTESSPSDDTRKNIKKNTTVENKCYNEGGKRDIDGKMYERSEEESKTVSPSVEIKTDITMDISTWRKKTNFNEEKGEIGGKEKIFNEESNEIKDFLRRILVL